MLIYLGASLKHIGRSIFQHVLCLKLSAPFHSLTSRCRSRSLAAIFCIKSCLFGIFLSPVMPTFFQNMVSEEAIDKDSLCIRPPRTTEIYFLCIIIMNKTTFIEHISKLCSFRCRGCRHITVFLTQDSAVFKPACRCAKNEICRALYPASFEILSLTFSVCVDSILICEETAVNESHPICIYRDCTGLSDILALSGRILYRQILSKKILSVKEDRRSRRCS